MKTLIRIVVIVMVAMVIVTITVVIDENGVQTSRRILFRGSQ